jgi:hypothetical protein
VEQHHGSAFTSLHFNSPRADQGASENRLANILASMALGRLEDMHSMKVPIGFESRCAVLLPGMTRNIANGKKNACQAVPQ